ncbi:MAG: hypothetical protein Q9161_003257 [Pseudevernia consocians]
MRHLHSLRRKHLRSRRHKHKPGLRRSHDQGNEREEPSKKRRLWDWGDIYTAHGGRQRYQSRLEDVFSVARRYYIPDTQLAIDFWHQAPSIPREDVLMCVIEGFSKIFGTEPTETIPGLSTFYYKRNSFIHVQDLNPTAGRAHTYQDLANTLRGVGEYMTQFNAFWTSEFQVWEITSTEVKIGSGGVGGSIRLDATATDALSTGLTAQTRTPDCNRGYQHCVGANNEVAFYSVGKWKREKRKFHGHSMGSDVFYMLIGLDGGLVASGETSGKLSVWDSRKGGVKGTVETGLSVDTDAGVLAHTESNLEQLVVLASYISIACMGGGQTSKNEADLGIVAARYLLGQFIHLAVKQQPPGITE